VRLVPARRTQLDRALPGGLDRKGAAAGRRAARAVLSERAGDGLGGRDARPEVRLPAPRPGIWRPVPPFPPPAETQVATARPFLLSSPSQLRPGPPPGLGSVTFRRDLAEVRLLGERDSSARTPEQTEVARFWAGSELDIQVRLLRQALRAQPLPTGKAVQLLSVYFRVGTDAEVAVFDAKYAYLFWRPITAIGSPTWVPLLVTPGHPEYPSAHTVYAAAAAGVLEHFFGAAPAKPLVVEVGGVRRTFRSWQQAVRENEDARVWSGIHFRSSDDAGSALGRAVAAYGLSQVDR
ncbi:MAG: vanadium-dependent haloperoxidase, partial [Mycobacteriales bacterium]